MSLFDWFANRQKTEPKVQQQQEREIADGLWTKCPNCGVLAYTKDLLANQLVCLDCGHHNRVESEERIRQLVDANTWNCLDEQIRPTDPLKFRDERRYTDRLKDARAKTNLDDAVLLGHGTVDGFKLAAAVQDFDFMGGSMGSVVGERFVRGVETAVEQKTPFVSFTATGGARMQEGLLSLMQMAKTNAALTLLAKAKLPYISVLTDPTMGGVSASFAFVGDIVIAEPKALIGFAGPRVIENTVREKLPEGFQRAEFLLQKGAVDMILDRRELRQTIARSLAMLQRQPADAVA